MRILVAYDGSGSSEAALEDLTRAGLPSKADALILTVTEAWHPRVSSKEAGAAVERAAKEIQRNFPKWKIRTETPAGPPASIIIQRAEDWKADLIVVGSHGGSRLGMRWGSVSQSVATHAHCSVRISRGGKSRSRDVKILAGIDGSRHSKVVLKRITSRVWPNKNEVRILSVFDPSFSTGVVIDREGEDRYQWLTKIVRSAEKQLNEAGLRASGVVRGGNPKRVLVEKAKKWGADCIFIGARGLSPIKRLLFGSVSAAVAMRSHCSVEIVRA